METQLHYHYLEIDAELDRIMALATSPDCPLPIHELWSAGPYVDGAENSANMAVLVIPTSWHTPEDPDHLAFAHKLTLARKFLNPIAAGLTIRWVPSMDALMFRGDYARARKFWSLKDPDILRRSVDDEPIGGVGPVAGDLDFIIPPDVWQFDQPSYQLLAELLADGTLQLEKAPEHAVSLMSTGRQRSLTEGSGVMSRFREDPEIVLKAMSSCWFRTPPLGRQEAFWFEPKLVSSHDGTTCAHYGTLQVTRLLFDLAVGRLRTWIAYPASLAEERVVYVFSRADPDDAAKLMKFRDKLLGLDAT